MNYLYYPGCSLESSSLEYDVSTRALMKALGVNLTEINNWNCCGASAAEPVSTLLSFALGARNLALAEAMGLDCDILVPCSACYINLKKVELERENIPGMVSQLNEILEIEDLSLQGNLRVRHLLDVLANDLGPDLISDNLKMDFSGLKLACYYGCQCLRPYAEFDDPEEPRSMEPFITATGAEVFSWDMGARCCGASQMSTKPETASHLVQKILEDAKGADAIITVCPM